MHYIQLKTKWNEIEQIMSSLQWTVIVLASAMNAAAVNGGTTERSAFSVLQLINRFLCKWGE